MMSDAFDLFLTMETKLVGYDNKMYRPGISELWAKNCWDHLTLLRLEI